MLTSATSNSKGVVKRLKRLRSELGYAQRRVFEIQTGVSARPGRRAKISRTVDELERLYYAA